MRKLIAILGRDPARIEAMTSWLDDRLYMYDLLVHRGAEALLRAIVPRVADILVLDLDGELLDGPEHAAGRDREIIAAYLASRPERFPILIHSASGAGPDRLGIDLEREGWPVRYVGPLPDRESIGDLWYPALKGSIHDHADVLAGVDRPRQG